MKNKPLHPQKVTVHRARIQTHFACPFSAARTGNKYTLVIVDPFKNGSNSIILQCFCEDKSLSVSYYSSRSTDVSKHNLCRPEFLFYRSVPLWSESSRIKQWFHVKGRSQSTDSMDRGNCSLKEALRKIASKTRKDWDEKLMVTLMVRCSVPTIHGSSSHMSTTGQKIRLPSHRALIPKYQMNSS